MLTTFNDDDLAGLTELKANDDLFLTFYPPDDMMECLLELERIRVEDLWDVEV